MWIDIPCKFEINCKNTGHLIQSINQSINHGGLSRAARLARQSSWLVIQTSSSNLSSVPKSLFRVSMKVANKGNIDRNGLDRCGTSREFNKTYRVGVVLSKFIVSGAGRERGEVKFVARRQEARRIVLLQNYFPLAATSEKGGGGGGDGVPVR